ncbi:Polysaccharide deacetylase [Pirellulimonas nuda]|uniref:Polysaccharide deacetylase n=1 Tax=Pirellulimonas nuda TaxID=2528009 RepID=A0A518DEW0_9BACT|nr:polysaccharide deacetylase family protein [Pirellulimonas nuda]QDU90010.1 Polysaccharide deacetylase [Pirellulimonas nuda]
MSRANASLSLDLDNQWAYLRSLGKKDWPDAPSYLPVVAGRVCALLARHGCGMTVFVVGHDLDSAENRDAVLRLAEAGCEIANHSQNHLPWLDRLDPAELLSEVVEAEDAIAALVGERPVGFRAPGFSWSQELFTLLAERGYRYDASTWPTPVGPLVSRYSQRLADAPAERTQKFGGLRDGFRRLSPYTLSTPAGPLVEVPVTTMPFTRLPIHATYLMHLWQKSASLARVYLKTTFAACRLAGVAPSMLLHPLDLLGGEEAPLLSGFPGMGLGREAKAAALDRLLKTITDRFQVCTIGRQVASLTAAPILASAPGA